MAKKIKFPLEMKDGVMVRTLEELRENFDAERLVEHYGSGKLKSWLADRYYDVELKKVSELRQEAENFVPLLCESLGIPVQEEEVSEIDAEFLKRRVEKLERLKSLTEDRQLLNRVDDIAMTQEDLADLLDSGIQEIYLCEGDFTIPVSVSDKTYIGIFNPAAVIRVTDNVNFKEQKIIFKDMAFIWDVSGLTPEDRSYQAERLFLEGRYEEAAAICRELVKEDNPRALMLLYRIARDFLGGAEEAYACRDKGAGLSSLYSLIDQNRWQFTGRYGEVLKRTARTGTSFDEFYYAFALYQSGWYQSGVYHEEMVPSYQKSAAHGNPCAYIGLANRYRYGEGVAQDRQKALEWYQKAAEKGNLQAREEWKVLTLEEEGRK